MDTPQDTAPEQQQAQQGADQALRPQDSPTASPRTRQRSRTGQYVCRKPIATQASILAQAALGASNTSISRVTGVSRKTIGNLISVSDLTQLREKGKTELARAITPAAKAVRIRVKRESKNDKGIAMHSMFLLKATGVAAQDGGVTVIADNAAVIMGSVPTGWESQFAPPGGSAIEVEGRIIEAKALKSSESAAD